MQCKKGKRPGPKQAFLEVCESAQTSEFPMVAIEWDAERPGESRVTAIMMRPQDVAFLMGTEEEITTRHYL